MSDLTSFNAFFPYFRKQAKGNFSNIHKCLKQLDTFALFFFCKSLPYNFYNKVIKFYLYYFHFMTNLSVLCFL